MQKLNRYFYGFVIGMCFEYAYRSDHPLWIVALLIGIAYVIIMIVDLKDNQ